MHVGDDEQTKARARARGRSRRPALSVAAGSEGRHREERAPESDRERRNASHHAPFYQAAAKGATMVVLDGLSGSR